MGVEGAAVTSEEAAQYRAACWWTDTTLSECVVRNAASTPDKPAYVDFSMDSPDRMLTWSEFDRAATNLAYRLLAFGVAPGDGVAVWHKDTSAIHVLLVGIERCGAVAVGLGARAGVREVKAILRTARPTLVVSDVERRAPAQRAAAEADYPRCDSTWPHSQRTIHEQINGLPGDIIRKVTWENASRLYQHPVPVAVQADPNAF